jgi:hypothetical protein
MNLESTIYLLGFKSSFGGYSKMMFFLEKIRGEETG